MNGELQLTPRPLPLPTRSLGLCAADRWHFTPWPFYGIIRHMNKARLVIQNRLLFDDGAILVVKVWRVPEPVPPSLHPFKYSLFYGYPGTRLVGYDNERGKGDHKHVIGVESPCEFLSIERLLADFRADVETVRGGTI